MGGIWFGGGYFAQYTPGGTPPVVVVIDGGFVTGIGGRTNQPGIAMRTTQPNIFSQGSSVGGIRRIVPPAAQQEGQ